jgi:hypothetical protein
MAVEVLNAVHLRWLGECGNRRTARHCEFREPGTPHNSRVRLTLASPMFAGLAGLDVGHVVLADVRRDG